MKSHTPLADASEHDFRYHPDFTLYICMTCGRQQPQYGTAPDPTEPGGRLRHDQRRLGCRSCRRQFTHKLPEELLVAFDQAAWDVGFDHGRQGLPEWRPTEVRWWAVNQHLAAYAAGYADGEAAREGAA